MATKDQKVEEARAAAAKRSTKKAKKSWGTYAAIGFVCVVTLLGVMLAAGGESKGGGGKRTAGASSLDKLVNDKGIISDANRGPNFTAAASPFFDKWTLGDLKYGFDGARLSNMVGMAGAVQRCESDDTFEGGITPRNFDARDKWPECYWEIRDSGNCTSSYAIAAASSLSARYCVADQEKYKKTRLSPQQVLSCDKKSQKCAGGGIDSVWSYLQRRGLHPDECLPYAGVKGAECKTTCAEDKKLKPISHCVMGGVKEIKRDVLEYGPVVAPVALSPDFLVYSGGVFSPIENTNPVFGSTGKSINHAVTIIGWGTEEGTPYWLIENSWGTTWGIDGYAKVAIGNGPVLEHYIVAGYAETEEALEKAEKKRAEEAARKEIVMKERAERNARIAEKEKARADERAAQQENDDFDDIDDDIDLDLDDVPDATEEDADAGGDEM